MKKLLYIVMVMLFFFLHDEGSATIHRVHPDPASMAPFGDPQSAIDSPTTFDGDSIYIEGAVGISVTYPAVFLYKAVHLFGPGYFLAENAVYADGYIAPEILQVNVSAPNCSLNGLIVHNLSLQFVNFVTIRKNKINSIQMDNASNCFFLQNYIQSIPGAIAIQGQNCFGNNFSNNFIGTADLISNGDVLISLSSDSFNSNNFFDHNTIVGGVAEFSFNNVFNNIFDQVQITQFETSTYFNNIFWLGIGFSEFDIAGSGNFFFVDLNTVFVPGSSGDAQWQTIDGSTATGNAQDGTDIGMFGGLIPYQLSGQELPVISLSVVASAVTQGLSLAVTFSFSSLFTTVAHGEYMLFPVGIIETTIGTGTEFSITPALSGTATISVDTFQPLGNYRLAYRLKDGNGRWSFTRESDLEIHEEFPGADDLEFIEYFVGNDPSFNLGIPEPNLIDSPNGEITFTIPLAGFAPGVHSISLRAADGSGQYGTTVSKTILVIEGDGTAELPLLEELEYFSGGDNGYETQLLIPGTGENAETYSFIANFPTTGIQQLQVRAKDVTGQWGTTQGKTIIIYPDEEAAPDLQKAEFFLDNPDPGYDAAPQFVLLSGTADEQTITIPLNGVPYGEHELWVRAKDFSGDYGTTQGQLFFTLLMAGDFTGDGCVNVSDLLVFMGSFGCDSPPNDYCIGDMNGDPTVNVTDLLLFMSTYGTGSCSVDELMLSE